MKIVFHLLRAALLGALLMITLHGLMLADPNQSETVGRLGDALAGGAVYGVAAALLLLLFRVGPVMKVVLGIFCGPAFPVLFFITRGGAEGGSHDKLGAKIVFCAFLGLLVGALDASRIMRMRRSPEAV